MRAALVQMSMKGDKEANLQAAERSIREAVDNGATLVCLPELFSTIYFAFETNPEHFRLAEQIPGPTIERFRALANELRIAIVAPLFEESMTGRYYNSAAVIDSTGKHLGTYRKTSIPLVSIPPRAGLEKYYFAPGDSGLTTFPTSLGITIGILICYDRHFPEAARVLALNGADVILVPTASSGSSKTTWEIELQAHALANQCYVGGVNRVGQDEGGGPAQWFGSSVWINPKGEIIARAGGVEPETLYAELDLDEIRKQRIDWAFFRDRRPDLYGRVVEQ